MTEPRDHVAPSPPAATSEAAWEQLAEGDIPETPVDSDLVRAASDLAPGRALDLGCGAGQNSVWLAQRGWTVQGVDIAAGAIERARHLAEHASVSTRVAFEKADVTTWSTKERFDLVVSTYALPPRGRGRTHALAVARDAVAPGGTALVAEFDVSLAASGLMSEEHLTSLDEVTTVFGGFELERAEVHVAGHLHGPETQRLPIVIVVARHPGSLSTIPPLASDPANPDEDS